MIGAALALSFWSGLFGPHGDVRHERLHLPRWTLDVKRDAFTGQTVCRLDGRGMVLERRVMTFRFESWTNTADALYRVDLGPVMAAGDTGPTVAGRGVGLSGRNLGNPSDGKVHIPVEKLQGAGQVRIRPSAKDWDKTFDLRALPDALKTAAGKGCADLA